MAVCRQSDQANKSKRQVNGKRVSRWRYRVERQNGSDTENHIQD